MELFTLSNVNDVTGSFEYKEDDPESIDVPFFNWETILDASNNFADANKLGAGGFGSVYRVTIKNIYNIL